MRDQTKRNPKPKQIYLDDDVWKKAGLVLKEVGISRSQFIEITFRNLARMDTAPSRTVYGAVMDDLFELAKEKTLDKVMAVEKEVMKPKKVKKKVPE
jgi:antitoxin component of RelBE/YafQ-DinJ toxin-antitoxin module